MLTPQLHLPLHHELIVDLFAGGGGASTGIEQATGRAPDIAINHDAEAVSLHQANHPQTLHFCSDVFEVDPIAVTDGRPVGLLWASPDCKHFSKAKGGKPVSKKIRSLAWVVVKWARLARPRVICLENVEEFQTWGPLTADNKPCPERKGRTFKRWKRSLEQLGYVVEHRELRACDYGAPTIRRRLFLVARCDGAPIVWPEPTHAAPDSLAVKSKKLKPWRTAAECIDWSIPAPSIFERARPLADATCRRIAKGIVRYVIDAAEPFIVRAAHGEPGNGRLATSSGPAREPGSAGCDSADRQIDVSSAPFIVGQGGPIYAGKPAPVSKPIGTVTTESHRALVVPTLIQTGYGEREGQSPRVPGLDKPLGTLVGSQKHALVAAFMAKHYGGVVGHGLHGEPLHTVTSTDHNSLVTANLVTIDNQSSSGGHGPATDPLKTTVTENRHALVTANLVGVGARAGQSRPRGMAEPLATITAKADVAITTSNLIKLRGDNVGQPTDAPLATVSAQGTHHAEVRAFLVKYYGTDQDPRLAEPMHTVPTKDRFGLVYVHGQPYAIADIGLRMLTPRELYRAQGFPEDYRIEHGADGKPLTKTAQVRMCGNSVCPPLARAIVAANYSERQRERKAA